MRTSTLLLLALVSGCDGSAADSEAPAPSAAASASDGLLRDFVDDGKLDEAGRPLSAHVTDPGEVCSGEVLEDGAVEIDQAGCEGPLRGSEQRGELTLDVRLRVPDVTQLGPETELATLEVVDADGAALATTVVTAGSVRATDAWLHFSLRWAGGQPVRLAVRSTGVVPVVLGGLELFPARFRLAIGPGSTMLDPETDQITIEWPLEAPRPSVELAELDLSAVVDTLVEAGEATETSTSYRQLLEIPVAALLTALEAEAELPEPDVQLALVVRTQADTARMQIRRAVDPCVYEGGFEGAVKVLVTGFEPFPADAWHDNVSEVGVRAIDPSNLRGAQLMRLILPVEYDAAAARVADAIRRCTPDVVIDFGQGGSGIALEETAYNLKDTSEVAGGAPDNRGVIATATPIAAEGPAEQATGLPLDAIATALSTLSTPAHRSDDPGRYICNNVFYRVMEATRGSAIRAGFVHLPYTTWFDEASTARWGRTLEAIIQAAVDAG